MFDRMPRGTFVVAVSLPIVVMWLVMTVARAASVESEVQAPVVSKGVVAVQRLEKGVLFADAFERGAIGVDDWRIWVSEPDRVDLAVKDGRFYVHGTGPLSHNGLWLKHNFENKDIVLIGRMDIRSDGSTPHHAVLHLCGGDMPRSPDHWVEVVVRDAGDQAYFSVGAALPEGFFNAGEPIAVPRPVAGGFLVKLELNGSANLCVASVLDGDRWRRIGNPLKLQVRTTHCEIKLHRQHGSDIAAKPTVSEAWFDDVRMYPRPESNPVLLRMVLLNGADVWYLPENGWPPRININGKEHELAELVVELWTADGKVCVDRVQSPIMGHYMLSLEHAPWDEYPVEARVRVFLDGRQLGNDAMIDVDGLDGLYPNDVWNVIFE